MNYINNRHFVFSIALFIVGVLIHPSYAQDYSWAIALGSTGQDQGTSIITDASGNVFVAGYFKGTVDFDPSSSTASKASAGDYDMFMAKYNSSGEYQWVITQGSTGQDYIYGLSLDGSGNLYAMGYFEGTVDFDPSSNTSNLVAFQSMFIAKYNSSGEYQWAYGVGEDTYGSSKRVNPEWSYVDASGNFYITGRFGYDTDFDPSSNKVMLSVAGGDDAFIAKFNSSGEYQWAKGIGGSGNDGGFWIHVDGSGNVYVKGHFDGTVDFDPSSSTANLTAVGGQDYFFAKYNSSGEYQWAYNIGTSSSQYAYFAGIDTDASGNVYLSGQLTHHKVNNVVLSSMDFNFSSSVDTLVMPGSGSDIFIAKYNSSMELQWVKAIGGGSNDEVEDMYVDDSGNIYFIGSFSGPTDFDPSSNSATLTSSYSDDGFIAKYNSSGEFQWVRQIGATVTADIGPRKFHIDASGNIYSTGWFLYTADFDPSSGSATLTSAGSYDIFVLKYVADTTSPTVSGVTSTSSTGQVFHNGYYHIGNTIPIGVSFSENVRVTGTPQLTLETGDSDATADYYSGSGSDTLTFNYTIASGHTSTDLDYKSTTSLALNSGTIKDEVGNAATLTLASPGASNSLGANKAIVIDGVVPTISSASLASNSSYVDITMSEPVYTNLGSGDGTSSLCTGILRTGADFTITFNQNGGNATGLYFGEIKKTDDTVLSGGETSVRLYISTYNTPSGVESFSISPRGTSIYDIAGNAMDSTQSTDTFTLHDKVSPAAPSSLTATTTDSQVKLLWKKNGESDVAKYLIYGGTTSLPTSKIDSTTSVSDTTKMLTGLANRTTHYYRLKAVDNSGNESDYSSEASVYVPGVYTVKTDGTGDYTTIQAGIDASVDGDTVKVYQGTYTENISILGKNIYLISTEGAEKTIIDGNNDGRVVSINSSAYFEGFTLINGKEDSGAGMLISTSNPKIVNVIVKNNVAARFGGGICTNNYATPTLYNIVIANNSAGDFGGGILVDGSSTPILINVTITKNSDGGKGGGIYNVWEARPLLLMNSIITDNDGSEIYWHKIYGDVSNPPIMNISHSDIFGEITMNESGKMEWLTENKDVDPLFLDKENDNFMLSNLSPIIGEGVSSITIDGNIYNSFSNDVIGNHRPSPSGSNPDMGAYENPLADPAPGPFELFSPFKGDTVEINRHNYTDSLFFTWTEAIDASGDEVYYHGELTGELSNFFLITGGAITRNMWTIPLNHVKYYMDEAGYEVATGTWTITAHDGKGHSYAVNGPFELTIDASSVSIDEVGLIPETFALHANYPNPFNPSTTISYDLPKRSQVTLGIYDLLGKKIKTLVNQSQDAGNKIAIWDGTDDLGRQVSAGVYLYQIQAGEFSQTRKMLLLK